MRKALGEMPNASETSAVTIRRNMADAVSYLTRVAEQAGMRTVAFKLAGVRVALLDPSLGEPEEPSDADDDPNSALPCQKPDGAADERGKLS